MALVLLTNCPFCTRVYLWIGTGTKVVSETKLGMCHTLLGGRNQYTNGNEVEIEGMRSHWVEKFLVVSCRLWF